MFESDIKEIRGILQNIVRKVSDTGDKGVSGQWNTYQYVANSQDTKAWAAGTKIGNELLNDLKKQSEQLKGFIESTKKFANICEEHLNSQEKINQGKY